MIAKLLAALAAVEDEHLWSTAYGLGDVVEDARLAGLGGSAEWYNAMMGLLQAEIARRAGRAGGELARSAALLIERQGALTHGELSGLLAMAGPIGLPMRTPALDRYFAALYAVLNAEGWRRVEAGGV